MDSFQGTVSGNTSFNRLVRAVSASELVLKACISIYEAYETTTQLESLFLDTVTEPLNVSRPAEVL